MRCFRLVLQSLESDHSLFGLTVTAINYVDVHAALSAATIVHVTLLTASPESVNFALSIIYIDRKKILLQRTRPIQSDCVYHIWTTGKIFLYFSISVLLC